jgi:hypothetical protein
VTDLRQRWELLDDEREPDDPVERRQRKMAGFVRGGLVAIVVFGAWMAISIRQQADDDAEVELLPPPRAVVEVAEGYEPSGLVEPDLSPTVASDGVWLLLADEETRLFDGAWVIAACRTPGHGEVGRGRDIVSGTIGVDLAVDTTDDAGVRVAATSGIGVVSAMVIDRRPNRIVTVVASDWDGSVAALAREVFDGTDDPSGGCDAAAALATESAGLPIRQERSLGAPIVPVGMRVVSADDSTIAWNGPGTDDSVTLSSHRWGTGGDDDDLLAFLRPPGAQEAEVLVDGRPGYRADYPDGSELLVWSDGAVLHLMSVGGGSEVDVGALASTLRTPTDGEWEQLAASVTG